MAKIVKKMQGWRLLAICVLGIVLAGCGGGGDEGTPVAPKAAATGIDWSKQETGPRGAVERARPARSPHARGLVLSDPAADAQRIAPRAAGAAGGPTPQRIGFGRKVPDTATPAATRALLQWQSMDNGRRAAALSVQSPQAEGVRLGLLVRALPAAATLRVYAQSGSTAYEVAAADVLDALESNRKAGDDSDAGRTWWAPLVQGQEATLEIELPPNVDPAQVDVALPGLSHVFTLPAQASTVTPKIGESGFCQVDVRCSADYDAESLAVLRLSFVQDGGSYLCSGTLLADRDNSRTPYVLTANHCISSQTVASTVESNWLYRAQSCGASSVDPQSTRLSGGATLLYATGTTDTSFIRLAAQAPAAATFAGWLGSAPALGSSVFDVHHPEGDLQKVATGSLSSFQRCTFRGEEATCSTGTSTDANFLNVTFTSGTTEEGSSGSALFVRQGTQRYVVGQLYGGSASCNFRSGSNIYGRLDIAYNAALHQWLDASPRQHVYRFFNTVSGAHFYTIYAAERDFVIATYPVYTYEGVSFDAYASAQPGLDTVYRFYNASTQAHFYTARADERDFVIATYPAFRYEGPVWYARVTPDASTGTTPLFRFFNVSTGAHFYTISAAERAFVDQTYPNLIDEGITYYVWPAP